MPDTFIMPHRSLEPDAPAEERVTTDVATPRHESEHIAVAPEVAKFARAQIGAAETPVNVDPGISWVRQNLAGALRGAYSAADVDSRDAAGKTVFDDPNASARERNMARERLTAAVAKAVATATAKLDESEQRFSRLHDDPPSRRATPQDWAWARDLVETLRLLTPGQAMPLLRRQLIQEPIATGKLARPAVMLPFLRSLYEKEKEWQTTETWGLLSDVEVVTRGTDWHAARLGLQTVARMRFFVGHAGKRFVETNGALNQIVQVRSGFYTEIGLTPDEDA